MLLYHRVATWAKLRDRTSREPLLLLNSHLDHRGVEARLRGTQLILRWLESLAQGLPLIVTGDFNCRPDSEPYQLIVNSDLLLRDATQHGRDGHQGPAESYTGFQGRARRHSVIDFVFVGQGIEVLKTATIEQWDDRQLSDHRALLADLQMRPTPGE